MNPLALREKGLLRVLIFAAIVAMLPNSVLFPAAKDISHHLHVPLSFIGLMISVYSIAYLVVTPILGVISDRLGRKWILVVALSLFSIGGIFPLVTHSQGVILVGRALMGMGSAGIMPTVLSIIGDEYTAGDKRRMALTWISTAIAVAEAILPFFSGVVDGISWIGVFMLYAVGFVASFAAFWIEPKQSASTRIEMKDYARGLAEILRHRLLFATLVSNVLFAMVYFGVSALLPLALTHHSGGFWGGLLFLPLGVSWVLINAWLVRRAGTHHALYYAVFAALILAVATLWLAFARDLTSLLLVSLLWGLGSGVLETIFTWVIAEEAPEEVRGVVNALFNASFILGFAIGAPLFLWLKSWIGLGYAALFAALIMVGASGIEWLFRKSASSSHLS